MLLSGRHCGAEIHRPAPARPDLGQEPLHVGHHRRWWFARQHALEVAARQAVLALEKERPCKFQAHPHQTGAGDQHGVERGYGLVQQCIPLVVRKIGLLRCAGPQRDR